MARPPSPPPPAQWPLPLLTPACHNRISGMGANNRSSQYSRPNSEMRFSTPFPTSQVGNGSFGVGPYSYDCYQRDMPMSLPQCEEAQIQKNRHDLLQHGTGVFHPSRESTEYRRANYYNIKGRRIEQVGGREDNVNCQNGRNENNSKAKMEMNCGSMKKEKKWKKRNKKENGVSEKEKKEEEEECYVPNLPPGIVLPMEWPYPDSF